MVNYTNKNRATAQRRIWQDGCQPHSPKRKRITEVDIIDKWLIFFLESIKELSVKLDANTMSSNKKAII
jgi:hypothetical protein